MTQSVLRDMIVAVLFLLLSALTLFYIIPSGIDAPSSIENAALSPSFWPTVIAWATLVSAAALLIVTYGARNIESPVTADEDELVGADYPQPTAILRLVFVVALLFLFYASLERYGLVVPSCIFLIILMVFFGEKKLFWVLSLGLGIPILLYVFFRFVAGISIPLGIFG